MKYRHQTQKSITIRFSITDFQNIEELAEKNGTTKVDIIRECWREFNKNHDISRDLEKLKISLLIQTFEICSAVAGLSEGERAEALAELKERIGGLSHERS